MLLPRLSIVPFRGGNLDLFTFGWVEMDYTLC